MKELFYRIPTGTMDILPDQIPLWRFVEETARSVFERYGYREIRTPLFEETKLFNRSIGDSTDIVSKEMYQVCATGSEEKESLSLRPEFTASIVRAYLENNLPKIQAFQKLYSIGAAFRHERPQKGRYRQFHQLNVEVLGSSDPLVDTEIIQLSAKLLEELGLKEYKIKLNSLGCPKCRENYRSVLQQHLSSAQPDLCADCQKRFTKNIFRVFDCKNEKCRAIVAKVPLVNYLCNECQQHFDKVKTSLTVLGVNYQITPTLVRGLDYYTRTVFEIIYSALGAQDAIGGGGRYDNLIESLGGPKLGAIGFAMGIERLIIALQAIPEDLRPASCVLPPLTAFIVTMDAPSRQKGFELLSTLRQAKISADMDYEGKSIKAQMRQASRINAKFVIIIGPDELAIGSVKIKNMQSGHEELAKLEGLSQYFHSKS